MATNQLRKIILNEEESVDVGEFCEQLREQARRVTGNSSAVDRLEWKAARIIEVLFYKLGSGPHGRYT